MHHWLLQRLGVREKHTHAAFASGFLTSSNMNISPLHCYGQSRWTVLEDEDISQSLQLQLGECAKCGYIKASNVVKIVSSPEMQENLRWVGVCKPTITEWTACNWLKKLNW